MDVEIMLYLLGHYIIELQLYMHSIRNRTFKDLSKVLDNSDVALNEMTSIVEKLKRDWKEANE